LQIIVRENRAKNFTIGAALTWFIIGPVIGGLLGQFGSQGVPFYAAAVLCLLNFCVWLFYSTRIIITKKQTRFLVGKGQT
jgi:DHA1 family tetracycline resistance protein-like MFS transporter